jgi:hypothetical protein
MAFNETPPLSKEPAMFQDAILFTASNAAMISTMINDYTTQDLLEEYDDWMLTHHEVVLVRDVLETGFASISYVVTRDMFETNTPGIQLNDKTFTYVRHV